MSDWASVRVYDYMQCSASLCVRAHGTFVRPVVCAFLGAPACSCVIVWAQYSIYLPVHYRRIKSLLFWDGTPFWDFLAA